MPKYSVTMLSPDRVYRSISALIGERPKITAWYEATSREEAVALAKADWPKCAVKSVRLLEDRSEWREIWWKALNNMPSRVHQNPNEKWVEVPKNTVPIGEFIKRQAQGTMRQNGASGTIYRRVVSRRTVRYQQLLALNHLLGYALSGQGHRQFYGPKSTKQKHTFSWSSVTNGLAFGTKPKGDRAELLKKLAGPAGAVLAVELLNK